MNSSMWRDLGVAGSLMRCCRPIVGMMSLWDTVAYGANSHSVALGIVYGVAKGPIADERGLIWWCQSQGCGVGVETGVGVCRSRPFCLESEWELESVKLGRLRLRSGVADLHLAAEDDFGRTVTHPPKPLINRKKRRVAVCR